jgi:hypothetical protein
MNSLIKLQEYQSQIPTSKDARTKLLKKQGWYYRIVYGIHGSDNNYWWVYKAHKIGKEVLIDEKNNYK